MNIRQWTERVKCCRYRDLIGNAITIALVAFTIGILLGSEFK